MPLWLLLVLGAGVYYLVSQGQAQAASSGALPSTDPGTGGGTTGTGDDFGPPQVASLAAGQSFSVPVGTALFTDSGLTKSFGSVMGSGPLNVTLTGTGVTGDGRVSASYVNSGSTVWFAQPGT